MIEAAVLVLTAGFAMAIGYIWGSRDAVENVLNHPDVGIWDYEQGRYLTKYETND